MRASTRPGSRCLQWLSAALLALALTAPGAQAAGKKAPAKKTVASSQVKRAPAKATAHKAAPKRKAQTSVAQRKTRAASRKHHVAAAPAVLSVGQKMGLHATADPLALASSVALVVDQDTHEVLLSKNDEAVLPIASLTKLMTGLLISEAELPMDTPITITQADVDTEKGSRSRLAVGTTLTRGELLHLALMSSENRAAHALGRTYPGGLANFVQRMNAKAAQLGMHDTHYVEPTGLSSQNRSSARDLARLVGVAYDDALLRELTTSPGYEVEVGSRTLQYNNTNRLVKSPAWDIGLQKTGYISEAGRCLVMQAEIAGRKLIMVFLDSAGKFSRLADAERVRSWLQASPRPAGHKVANSFATNG
ncbi:D-alanyl-D-alanine carboxypeptidase family protein [Comamonas sp. NLF-1-9]|uniref:D-alanyl-D-alanine carboxypeptidase family protein n=1 Tax=Comamonas sp. NLF-1-9 TaxID=2853163 RepID=UPI001C4443AE|nr:serine hydrolase [Comamonas sp. NLF-1-9]QXL84593.1 serine hydrolase [Comamonas sp. NLF-1-9]